NTTTATTMTTMTTMTPDHLVLGLSTITPKPTKMKTTTHTKPTQLTTSLVKSPTTATSAMTMEATTQDEDWLTRNTTPLVSQTRSGCTDEPRNTKQFVPVNDITKISYDVDAYIESTPAETHDNTGTYEGGHRDIRTTGSPRTITRGARVYPMTTPMTFSQTSFSVNPHVIAGESV
ncbi:hypothetical protein LSAT2_011860, partial [Lamellibrachia satsuma]